MMENYLREFEDSAAFWPVFAVVFPLVFVAIWTLVLGITSHVSGWRRLAKVYRYQGEEVVEWIYRGGGGVYDVRLPFAGMRGRLAVGACKDGIVIKPPLVISPFHPQLFLPFDRIVEEEPRKLLMLEFVALTLRDAPNVRVGILKSARQMAERVQQSGARSQNA